MKSRTILAALLMLALITAIPTRGHSQNGITVTNSNLKTTLENMGFEAKELSANNYEISVNLSYKVYMAVALSPDESRIWLTTFFYDKSLSTYSSEKLIKLLQSNWTTGVSFFALDSTKLKMTRPIENRNVTPVLLRKEIENHARNVESTEALWNDKK
jgi:hypothetical protein